MILVNKKIINSNLVNFQEKYNAEINDIFHVMNIKCPYCDCRDFLHHGYYNRYFFHNGNVLNISLTRIKCKNCSKTHALFTYDLIPYCFINTSIALKVIRKTYPTNCIEYINDVIVTNIIKRIRKLKKHYLHYYNIDLSKDNIESINSKLIQSENRMFLQIHRGKVFSICNST